MLRSLALLGPMLIATIGPLHAQIEGIKTHKEMITEVHRRIETIGTAALARLIEEDPNLVLLDVRMPHEVKAMGHIDAPQQLNIPRGWVEVQIINHVIDRDTPIVAYCGAGIRSAFVADTLRSMGFTNVRDYAGGFLGWQEKGMPVAR